MAENTGTKTTKNKGSLRFVANVLWKTLLLLVAANLLFVAIDPMPALGKVSLYNNLFKGRERLPFGEDSSQAYNLSLSSLEAMFASHEVSQSKSSQEYRVLVIGDSSVWGILLKPEQTLAGQINAAGYQTPDGRKVKAYNLGYPTLSLTKDLLIMDWAQAYHADMIIWMVTLEAFPNDQQLSSPLLQENPQSVRALIAKYKLNLNPQDPNFSDANFWQRTLFGERRNLADLFRLQWYGALWTATGIDQAYPASYTPRENDLAKDATFDNLTESQLSQSSLAFDVLEAGMSLGKKIPILLVNEPMFIADGKNSDIRYNFYYPRWAYDEYRQMLSNEAQQKGWSYLDLWDAIPSADFTNSAIHLNPQGSSQLAKIVGAALTAKIAGSQP